MDPLLAFAFQRAMNEKIPADYAGGSLGTSDRSSVIGSDLSSNLGSFQEQYLREPIYPDTSSSASDTVLEFKLRQIKAIQSQSEIKDRKKILPGNCSYDSISFSELVRLRGGLDYHVTNPESLRSLGTTPKEDPTRIFFQSLIIYLEPSC